MSSDYKNGLRKQLEFKEQGKLIIITSNHKEDIEKLCDVIIKMADGEISSVDYKEYNVL